MKYIAQAKLTCHEDIVVFEGTLVGTEEMSGAELLGQLQDWVDTGPTINIMGLSLVFVMPSYGDDKTSASHYGLLFYAAGAGGAAFLVVSTIILVLIVVFMRKCRKKKDGTNGQVYIT